jgi:hypothetical protein
MEAGAKTAAARSIVRLPDEFELRPKVSNVHVPLAARQLRSVENLKGQHDENSDDEEVFRLSANVDGHFVRNRHGENRLPQDSLSKLSRTKGEASEASTQ